MMAAKDHLKYMSSNEKALAEEVKNKEGPSNLSDPSLYQPKEETEELRALYEANAQLLQKRNENEQTINQMKKVINDFLSSTEVAERKINQLILENQDSDSKLIVLEEKLNDLETKQNSLRWTAQKENSSSQDLSPQSEKCSLLVDLNNAETRIEELEIDLRNASKRIEMLESKLSHAENSNDFIETQQPYELLKIKNHQSKNQLIRRESLKKLESSEDISFGDSKSVNHCKLDILDKNFSIDNLGQTEDSELNRLWSELSLARQQITSLEVDKAQAFNEINDLKQIDEHAKSDFEDLQQKYERSQRSLRSLEQVMGEKDEGGKDDEVQVLRTEVVELKRRVDELEDEKLRARKEVVDLEFDLKGAREKLSILEKVNNEKKVELIKVSSEKDMMAMSQGGSNAMSILHQLYSGDLESEDDDQSTSSSLPVKSFCNIEEFEALQETEDHELHRLWTELSNARARIIELEEEEAELSSKIELLEANGFKNEDEKLAKQSSSHSEESELALHKFQLVQAQSEKLLSECDQVISHLKPPDTTLSDVIQGHIG